MVSEDKERLYLHFAKIITDKRGYIYMPAVLDLVDINHIVRISFEVDFVHIKLWSHDSPYIRIIDKNEDGSMLGEIVDVNRIETCNYPLAIGERIWIRKENIIEIPDLYNNYEFSNLLTENKVVATGPLYTVESDSDNESDSDSISAADSCSESE